MAENTVAKGSPAARELMARRISGVFNKARGGGTSADAAEERRGRSGRFARLLSSLRHRKRAVFIGVVILGLLMFGVFRFQVTVKSMIDSSSEGADYLNIAFADDAANSPEDALLLAGEKFARLRAQLEGSSWLIAMSKVIPPAHDQFAALDSMADLGPRLVAAPLADSGRGHLRERGSATSICASVKRLESHDGNLLGQIEKNRKDMLAAASAATGGACGNR